MPNAKGQGRKPTTLKVLRGNPGKRKINIEEPTPDVLLPDPPGHLD